MLLEFEAACTHEISINFALLVMQERVCSPQPTRSTRMAHTGVLDQLRISLGLPNQLITASGFPALTLSLPYQLRMTLALLNWFGRAQQLPEQMSVAQGQFNLNIPDLVSWTATLTLYQAMAHMQMYASWSLHKPMGIYMGDLILGVIHVHVLWYFF